MIRRYTLALLFLTLPLTVQTGVAQSYDRNYPTNPYQDRTPNPEYGSFSYPNNGAPNGVPNNRLPNNGAPVYGAPYNGAPYNGAVDNRRPINDATVKQGWQARNLLFGPAAIVKGVGASVWCIGSASYAMYRDVDSFGEGFVRTLLWPFAVTIDSIGSAASYEVIGLAHTITGGALVSEPPKQIEEMDAPIYCVLSDNMD